MLFSKSELAAGGSGFFTAGDKNAPDDAVNVQQADFLQAINLPRGAAYDFDADGALTVTPAPAQTAAELLATAQAVQAQSIKTACAAAITTGFTSTALGTSAAYGSQATDQANLLSVVASAAGGSLWCQETGTAWSFVEHTAGQASKVLADWQTYRAAQQSKYASLVAQVNAATTAEAVQAINW